MHIICNMIMDTGTVNVLSSDNMALCLSSIGMLLYIITSGQTCPSGTSLRVLGVCQLVGHRLVMPLLLRPQLVMHWLVMHVLTKDTPGWPGDVSVTDLATMCACKFTLKITID